MIRHLLTLLSVVSLALCVATIALGIRSHYPLLASISGGRANGRFVAVNFTSNHPGKVLISLYDEWPHPAVLAVRARGEANVRREGDLVHLTSTSMSSDPRLKWTDDEAFGIKFTSGTGIPRLERYIADDSYEEIARGPGPVRYWRAYVPAWIAATVVGLPGILVFGRRLARSVRRRRLPPGACVNCGYDLRASPDRCPECGTVPASATAPV